MMSPFRAGRCRGDIAGDVVDVPSSANGFHRGRVRVDACRERPQRIGEGQDPHRPRVRRRAYQPPVEQPFWSGTHPPVTRIAIRICWSRVARPASGAYWRPPKAAQTVLRKPIPEYVGPVIAQLPPTSQTATRCHAVRSWLTETPRDWATRVSRCVVTRSRARW